MANHSCRHRPTFQDLVYTLDSLLDEPDALRSYFEELERHPSCRALLVALEEASDQLGHDAPLVVDEVRHREAIYRELIRLEPRARHRAIEAWEEGIDFRSWGVVDLLIKNAPETASLDEARELADLALFIAQRLEPDLYHPVYLADLEARVQATLALIELRADHLDEACRFLDLAQATARLGLGENLTEIARAESELLDDVEARHEPHPPASRDEGFCKRLLSRLLRYAQNSQQNP